MHHSTPEAPRTAGSVIRGGGLHGARRYDLFTRIISLGRDRAVREQLIELAAPAPGEAVLDIGCGTGTLALAIRPKVATGRVHGIDASPEMVQVATEKAARAGADVDFRVALVEALPFADATFDLVTSSLMLHHLPDALKAQACREVRRVLKPGGRFTVLDFATESHGLPGHLLSILGHSHGVSALDHLLPLLHDAGFADVEVLPTRFKNFAFIRAS